MLYAEGQRGVRLLELVGAGRKGAEGLRGSLSGEGAGGEGERQEESRQAHAALPDWSLLIRRSAVHVREDL